jgi:hypothetical protein
MSQEEISRVLQVNRNRILIYPVRRLYLFGSYLRRSQKRPSAIDMIVELSKPIGFFTFLELKILLEKVFGRSVDLVTKKVLHPLIKAKIVKEAVRVF